MSDTKLNTKSISDAVFERLRSSILEGVVAPGERLASERHLSEELNVSRSSVREALQRLLALGLVEHRHGGGTYVSMAQESKWRDPLVQMLETRQETFYELLETRLALEYIAAHYAALRATDADREILELRLNAISAAHEKGNAEAEADADALFHLSLADAAHNAVLAHVMRGVLQALRTAIATSSRKLFSRKGMRDEVYEQHREIFEAIAAGDSRRSRKAVTQHLEYVKTKLRELEQENAWEENSRRRLDALT